MLAQKSKRKKILLLARSLDSQSAGIHVYTKNLILHLEKHGDHQKNEYTIVRVGNKVNLSLKNVKQVLFKNKYKIPAYASLRLFFLVPLYANKNDFDVVVELSHFGPVNISKKTKRVTVMHDLTPILHSHFHNSKSSILQKIFLPRFLRNTDLIISNSENTQNDILKTYPKITAKADAIYLGVDDIYKPTVEKNLAELSKYKITQNYILYLGTIEPRKNLVVLLKAFDAFKQKNNTDLQLIFAGSQGWKNEAFFKTLAQCQFKDDIKLIGFVDNEDLPKIYSNAEVFIYPSSYEGFGLPVVEALSSGTQVICSDNSSLLEFGEEFVTYFSTDDPDSLAEKLTEVLIEKKTVNIDYLKLKEKYSWKSYVSKFEENLKLL